MSQAAKVKVNAEIFSEVIASIARVAAPFNGSINIEVKNGQLKIESRAELSILFVDCPTEAITGECRFGVMFDALKAACSHRKGELVLSYENSVFKVAAKNYKTELATVDYVEYNDPVKVDETILEISAEQSQWLKEAINIVALAPNLTSPIMPIAVKVNAEEVFVACYCRDHIAFIRDNELLSETPLEFAIPSDAAIALFSIFNKSNFTLASSSTFVKAYNHVFTLYLSLPATDAYLPHDLLQQRITLFLGSESTDIHLPFEEMTAFFANSKSVATKERGEILVQTSAKRSVLSRTTSNGTVKAAFEGNKANSTVELKLDEEYLKEAIGKIDKKEKEVIIKCQDQQGFVLIPGKKNSHSVIALNK